MPATVQTLTFQMTVKAPTKMVYWAFTNATSLREWFCNIATVDPKPGGHLFMGWNSGFYASGEYLETKPNRRIEFTWFGRGEPRPTKVRVRFSREDGGTHVTLEHLRVGTGPKWERVVEEIKEGWTESLDNLASVLESGEDLRFTRRPMLGIGVSDFNEAIAKQLGVPVSKGIRIDSAIEGMGAKAAGLQASDVIVELDGVEIMDGSSLFRAVQPHRAGDTVEVAFYRGSERKSVMMELSKRPLPEIPETIQPVAEQQRQRNERAFEEIDKFIMDVSEEEAGYKPSKGDWSAKEVLAHLIHGERDYQSYISDVVGGYEAHYDDYGGNLQARIDATLATYPSLLELSAAYKRSANETASLLERLPKVFRENKGSFWRIAYNAFEGDYHFFSHFDQMKEAIEAAKKR